MTHRTAAALVAAATAIANRKAKKAENKRLEAERRAVVLAEYNRLEGIRLEAEAEERAPAAQRQPVHGHTASSLRAARKAQVARIEALPAGQRLYVPTQLPEPPPIELRGPIAVPDPKVGGYRRVDCMLAMFRNGKGRTVTADHLRAKEKFRDDYQLGIARANMPKSGTTRVDGSSDKEEEFGWLQAAQRYRRAMAAIGPSLQGVVFVMAVGGWDVPQLAQQINMAENVATGLVVAAFDSLADHYWPARESRVVALARAVAATTPLGFDFAVSALGRLPADRIGFGKKVYAAAENCRLTRRGIVCPSTEGWNLCLLVRHDFAGTLATFHTGELWAGTRPSRHKPADCRIAVARSRLL